MMNNAGVTESTLPEASEGARSTQASAAAPAASTRGLTKVYGSGDAQVVALGGVSVDIFAREFTAIMGPSGSGKSTLMHCAAGLDAVTQGQVFIGDVELTALKEKDLTALRRDKVGFVFQAFNLIPTLSARENILLPLAIAGSGTDPPNCPVVSSNGSPAPGRWSAARRSSLRTNPPATSIPGPAERS